MLTRSRTRRLVAATTLIGFALVIGLGAFQLRADDDDDAEDPERARVAAEALQKSIANGKDLWNDKAKLGLKKSCAQCHEDPDKPKLDLSTRVWAYPAYSRRKRAVITLQQKINEMIKYSCRGDLRDGDSTDLADLAAYTMSLKK